jgi:hypothetical protein
VVNSHAACRGCLQNFACGPVSVPAEVLTVERKT